LVLLKSGDVVRVRVGEPSDCEVDCLVRSNHARGHNVFLERLAESSASHGSELRGRDGDEKIPDTVELREKEGKGVSSWRSRGETWMGRVDGSQAYGLSMSPVLKRIGLGSWQAISSSVGVERKSRTLSQKGLPVVVPWVKFIIPGPSVVPAAKEYPRAALQRLALDPSARVT
jgi:hypothetical protein